MGQLQQDWTSDPLPWISVGLAVILNVLFWCLLLQRTRLARSQQEAATHTEPTIASESDLFENRQRLLRMLAAHTQLLIDGKLEVRHAMAPQPCTVTPATTLDEAREKFQQHQVRHLLVCDADGQLCGVILSSLVMSSQKKTCAEVMLSDLDSVAPETNLLQALTALLQSRFPCVAVTRCGTVIGELTMTDGVLLTQAIIQLLTRISDRIRPALASRQAPTITAVAQLQTESLVAAAPEPTV
jgi:CBS-domain-containing membrane protein